MAAAIRPILLHGNWDLGFALDVHIVKSIPLEEDAYGHMRFETTRSPIGELLYQFKYTGKYEVLPEIVDAAECVLDAHPEMKQIGTLLPVPPTKQRAQYQPTIEIAQSLAERLKVFCCPDVLENVSQIAAKDLSPEEKQKLQGRIIKKKNAVRKHSTLLIDDLYQTGNTLRQCVSALREDPLIDKIYVLTITKAKAQ